MSTTNLSVMLLIYSQIIYMIFYLHYFGYVGGVKYYYMTLWWSYVIDILFVLV